MRACYHAGRSTLRPSLACSSLHCSNVTSFTVDDMSSSENIEEVVAYYLRHARPSAKTVVSHAIEKFGRSANQAQIVEDALQLYIAKLDKATQERILPDFVRRKKRRRIRELSPQPNETAAEASGEDVNEELVLALAFLNERQGLRNKEAKTQKSAVDSSVVRSALEALHDGYAWICDHEIGELWTSDDLVISPEPYEGNSPLQRLAISFQKTFATVRFGEYKRRILALLMHHECRKNGICISKEGDKELENLIGFPFRGIYDFRSTAQAWLRVINSWGLGGLMMPGLGGRSA